MNHVKMFGKKKRNGYIIFEGDSMTTALHVTEATSYPAQLMELLGSGYKSTNAATTSELVTQMLIDGPAQVDAAKKAGFPVNIAILWGGTNDLNNEPASAATVHSRIFRWHASRQRAGLRTIALTICHRNYVGDIGGINTVIDSLNTLLLADQGGADMIVDVAGNADLLDPDDTEFFHDGLHLTAAGYAIVAGMVASAIRAAKWDDIFAPSQISSLSEWLRAGEGLFLTSAGTTGASMDTDVVGLWTDLSGRGYDFTQADAGKMPILRVNIKNGQSVVRFDGTDNVLGAAGMASSEAKTIFFVACKLSAPSAGARNLCALKPTLQLYARSTTGTGWVYYDIGGAGVSLGGAPASWGIITLKYVSLGSMIPYFDGAAAAGRDPANGYASGADSQYLGGGDATPIQACDVDIAEMIVFTETLSDADLARVHDYLSKRYDIALI